MFIDARKIFRKVDRTHNEFTDEQIKKTADTYHVYRGEAGLPEYKNILGFCKVATIEEIRKNGYVLTPGRYVGTEELEGDGDLRRRWSSCQPNLLSSSRNQKN